MVERDNTAGSEQYQQMSTQRYDKFKPKMVVPGTIYIEHFAKLDRNRCTLTLKMEDVEFLEYRAFFYVYLR